MDLNQLRQDWKNGDALEVGRELLAPLSPAKQAARSAAVLDLARTIWAPVPEIEAVSEMAREPDQWKEGHKLFCAVRALTLVEEKSRSNETYYALLFVAEITAKTIYNASKPRAPFDEDSPWWVAQCARDLAAKIVNPLFEERIWQALTGTAAPKV